MFGQSIFILIRRFTKDPAFSLATMFGLVFGLTAFVIIGLFINSLFSWDKYNKNYDRIYRVQVFMDQKENKIDHSSSVTAALSRNDLVGLPEIEKIALIHDVGNNNKDGIFLSPDKHIQFLTRWGYFADPTVFDIFTFQLIEGTAKTALNKPLTIVLSKSCAYKFFKGESALGKQIYLENKIVLTVTGVYEDLPEKSTWNPSFLLPMQSFTAISGWENYENEYKSYSFHTYVLLKPNADPASVDAKIHDAMKEYRKEHYPYLRPMSMLYINAYFEPDYYIAIGLLIFNALLILILSSVNYINLQTANASTRFREIGIKKAVGFTKKQLWYQFMTESIILSFTSGLFALILARLLTPSINNLMGSELFGNIFYDRQLIVIVIAVSVLTGIVSGIHPAFVISAFNPVKALKQKFIEEKSNGINLKKILVTVQFSIAIFLLTVGFIIYRQTHYMVTKNMGFESNNLLFSNLITDKKGSITGLRQNLLQHPEIINVCHSDYIPFILPGGSDISWEGGNPEERVFIRYSQIGFDFVSTFDLKIVNGRNFSREYPSDYDKCLLNETAVNVFGWADPIGRKILIRGKTFTVMGILKDYVVFSVHSPIEPHFYRLVPDTISKEMIYSVRFKPGYEKEAKEIVTKEFELFFADDAFEFKNIQTRIRNENSVKAWSSLMKINIFFAILSIIASSIGLFGLILFFTRHKLKEVGIRKVLGFSNAHLFFTLSSGFIKLLPISIIFAWPAAWYAYKTLPGADKYHLQIWEFIIATSIIFLVALATVSYQILKALKVKPVEILKDE